MHRRLNHRSRSQQAVSCFIIAVLGFATLATVSACAAEAPAAAEKNPPGDIPDNQVFITYQSPHGFSVKVPEGWARADRQDGVRFTDKYNTIDIAVTTAATAPTRASVIARQVPDLINNGHAVKVRMVKDVKLQAGPAILIDYTSNSEPNPVTNKQSRLENNRYLLYRSGKLATLDVSAPLGADNVDQWYLIANAFRWR